jgi:hypothetical protein
MGNCVSNRLIRLEDLETFVPSNIKYQPEDPLPSPFHNEEPGLSERVEDDKNDENLENQIVKQIQEEEPEILISEHRKKEFHELDNEIIFDKRRHIEKDPVIKRVRHAYLYIVYPSSRE